MNMGMPEELIPMSNDLCERLQRLATHPGIGSQAGMLIEEGIRELERLRREVARGMDQIRGIVNHWNEFGPADGFDEQMHRAGKYLERPQSPAETPQTASNSLEPNVSDDLLDHLLGLLNEKRPEAKTMGDCLRELKMRRAAEKTDK
jgi:hypothetical protein